MRFTGNERKRIRSKSKTELSDAEVRMALANAEKLYVLGINSEFVNQAHRAVMARFGESPEITACEPVNRPALCVKMVVPNSKSVRPTDIRMQFFMA